MKNIVTALVLALSALTGKGQDPSLIFARIIKDTPDTVWSEVRIWKKAQNGESAMKSKRFHNQTLFSLAPGEYVIEYAVSDSVLFVDELTLEDEPSTVIMNVLLKPGSLHDFDFSKVIAADPILYDFVDLRYRHTYIEF